MLTDILDRTKFQGRFVCLVVQSRPALCNLMDCSPPCFSVHEDSPGKNTGVGCHALLYNYNYFKCLNNNQELKRNDHWGEEVREGRLEVIQFGGGGGGEERGSEAGGLNQECLGVVD